MEDIKTRKDVEKMVVTFYDRVMEDELLSPVFINVYWPHHLPIMYDFWSSILLGDRSYNGSPMTKHIDLVIKTEHFDRWLKLFKESMDDQFAGPVAQEAKTRAEAIATMFQYKMGLIEVK
ncbi:MAG TPA: group III truncated hemoglobin [Cyclobacteriaceae bacterium]|nr:group III truncated hemoglobin [Cyclobacteriaceae bacterium]